MDSCKTTGWVIGIIIGASIGVLLPIGLNIIAGLLIAWLVMKLWVKVSTVEIEEDDEYFI